MSWNPVNDKYMNEARHKIISDNIKRDPLGKRLTPDAHNKAVDFALKNWPPNAGNGEAAQLGIKHVTSNILKD